MSERNFLADIEDVVGDEHVEVVVIGQDQRVLNVPDCDRDPISWDEARKLLNYYYDDDFGCADCHAITLWTATKVVFVHEYDGSTTVVWVPRNPVRHTPGLSGIAP